MSWSVLFRAGSLVDTARSSARVRAILRCAVRNEPLGADRTLRRFRCWRLQFARTPRFQEIADRLVASGHIAKLAVADVQKIDDRSDIESRRTQQELDCLLFECHMHIIRRCHGGRPSGSGRVTANLFISLRPMKSRSYIHRAPSSPAVAVNAKKGFASGSCVVRRLSGISENKFALAGGLR